MGEIIVSGSIQDLYNPTRLPDVSGLVPTITGVAPEDMSTLSPPAGAVISMNGATSILPFGENINGWRGTQENPIWVLGNGSNFNAKSLNVYDCEWVYFENFGLGESTTVGMDVQQSQDIIFNLITCNNTGNNGIRIWGTATDPNARIQLHNVTISNWTSADGLTIHADGSENDNGSWFLVKNLNCQNPTNQGENGLDFTSGNNLWLIDYSGIDANVHVAHGVNNFYAQNLNFTPSVSQGNDKSIELRNTDGSIIISGVTEDGALVGGTEIDLGVTNNPRSNETPNSVLDPNGLLGLYITHELQLHDNNLLNGVDNNTSGDGTIVTNLNYNTIPYIPFSGFNRWPNTL